VTKSAAHGAHDRIGERRHDRRHDARGDVLGLHPGQLHQGGEEHVILVFGASTLRLHSKVMHQFLGFVESQNRVRVTDVDDQQHNLPEGPQ
jgi:hypothetical protein